MSRPLHVVLLTAVAVAVGAALPGTAMADNCSGLSDCYAVLEAAAIALLAMAILAFLVLNPGLLLGAASLLESLLFSPVGWLTGWGRTGAMAAAGAEAGGAEATVAALRALGPRAFNPGGGSTNCWSVANATLNYMRTGTVNPALPGYAMDLELAAAGTGSSFTPATFEGIYAGLAAGGPGSGGIVGVLNPATGMGHFFAAANVNGAVIFADMQAAAVVSASASEAAAAAGYGQAARLVIHFLAL